MELLEKYNRIMWQNVMWDVEAYYCFTAFPELQSLSRGSGWGLSCSVRCCMCCFRVGSGWSTQMHFWLFRLALASCVLWLFVFKWVNPKIKSTMVWRGEEGILWMLRTLLIRDLRKLRQGCHIIVFAVFWIHISTGKKPQTVSSMSGWEETVTAIPY